MLILLVSKLAGRALAALPESWVAWGVDVAGALIVRLPIDRVRIVRSNLHHAFPDKDAAWRERVARLTASRLLEMACFALASPYFSRRWFQSRLTVEEGDDRDALFQVGREGGLFLLPHTTLVEMTTALPAVFPLEKAQGVAFRPLKQPALDRWVKTTRERWGARLLSRKDGVRDMMEMVSEGNCLALLFDQNTGKRGNLFFFLDRLASGTHLPGLVAKKYKVSACLLIPRRVGFWKVRLSCQPLPSPKTPTEMIHTSHEALAAYLHGSEEQCADWLWFHHRWGTHDKARNRFFIRPRHNHLEESASFYQYTQWPQRTRIWFRMPNWLGDVVMALPLIRAVRRGRPDAEVTLLIQPALRPLLERIDAADRLLELPPKGKTSAVGYFGAVARWRGEYPDALLCLTNSWRGDVESFLTRAPLRLGMLRAGKWRPLLTDPWAIPGEVNEKTCHQVEVWESMFRHYGLREAVDLTPFPRGEAPSGGVGMICGTENSPEKRWPVGHWRALIERFLESTEETISLYGTPRDREITDQVAQGFDGKRVRNLAGETDLGEFVDAMRANRVVICNDTGGMHLANMFGVPVIALFGPTNPVRTGPVFEGPRRLLQPPECPPTGGRSMEALSVSQVWEAWAEVEE